jgi:hypothetical protein
MGNLQVQETPSGFVGSSIMQSFVTAAHDMHTLESEE